MTKFLGQMAFIGPCGFQCTSGSLSADLLLKAGPAVRYSHRFLKASKDGACPASPALLPADCAHREEAWWPLLDFHQLVKVFLEFGGSKLDAVSRRRIMSGISSLNLPAELL